ncbi:MAG: hypothetical protein HYT70_04705 [Candidatus Aenigmarchaeota archaeon]|nr:hypothetical protein [Candidatus Aenigmarchaeota archaeon]
MRKRKRHNELVRNAFVGLAIALVIIYGINIFLTNSALEPIRSKLQQERPANLHFALITAADCENCYDMSRVAEFIKDQNVNVVQEKNLDYKGDEAQDIIAKNGIASLPALVITGEVSQANIAHLWARIGVEAVDNVVVIDHIPPYYRLDTERVVGLVEVIRLTDNSCLECYDVENHMQVLPNFGIYVDKSLTYDVSSTAGKELLQKYSITKVPTIILSPDASVYPSLVGIWNDVGTVEDDGWYVFRSTELMGTYKDLDQNKVVNATR